MQINVQKFQTKTETEIKNYNTLKNVLSKIYETEIDLNKKRNEAFEEIKNINEENRTLKGIYGNFSEKMQSLEKEKENQFLKIKTKLIPTTDAYITEAKRTKQEIGNYKNIQSKAQGQEEEIEKMKRKGQDVKSSQMSANLNQSRSAMVEVGKSIEDQIIKYEKERIDNNKLIMLHLINYEMAYHAKAIQELTTLFKEIKEEKLKKSIKESVLSVGISQNVVDNDDNEEEEEENEKNEEDEDNDDNEGLKKSKLSKSKKTTGKSINKSKKNDDENEIDENTE